LYLVLPPSYYLVLQHPKQHIVEQGYVLQL